MELPEFRDHFGSFAWPWYTTGVEEYKDLLSKHKFSRYNVWGEEKKQYFPDANSIIGWIEEPCLIPFVAVLPEELKTLFRDLVIDKMLQRTEVSGGIYLEVFRRINVYCEK